jgi:hypothetical protein
MILKSIITASILVFTLLSASCSMLQPSDSYSVKLESCITAAQLDASSDDELYELDAEEARLFCESYLE